MAARRPISGLSNTSRRRLDLRFDVLDLLRKQVAQYACHGFGYRCQWTQRHVEFEEANRQMAPRIGAHARVTLRND